jgi:ABC-type antimicrobial peptide transport system permease subunit
MILSQGARLAGMGVAIGLLFSLWITQLMHGFLYGVKPTDPFVYSAAVSMLLLSVALLACYMPARRATRVDPMIALRDE